MFELWGLSVSIQTFFTLIGVGFFVVFGSGYYIVRWMDRRWGTDLITEPNGSEMSLNTWMTGMAALVGTLMGVVILIGLGVAVVLALVRMGL
jgi:hypothetical protein